MPLTKLNALDEAVWEDLEDQLVPYLQRREFSSVDLRLVIQLAHRNNAGGLPFWRLLHNLYGGKDYSELFAMLGGYERNHHTDEQLFVQMVALDSRMDAINLQE